MGPHRGNHRHVVRIWDDRRLVVPLQYFIEKPFQNWTRRGSSLIGTVFLWADYSLPLEPLRSCGGSADVPELWDGRVCVLQVTDASEKSIQLRALVSSGFVAQLGPALPHPRESLASSSGSIRIRCRRSGPIERRTQAARRYVATAARRAERQPPV